MRQTLESIVRVVCLIALGAVVASAQPGGQLTGVVRDTTGSVLPGVTVTVTGAALIAPRTVVTDEHGEYAVDALPAGRYLVTAAFSGFEPSSVEVDVEELLARRCDLVLAVSSLSERVTVTATKTGAADVQSTPIADDRASGRGRSSSWASRRSKASRASCRRSRSRSTPGRRR